MMQVVISFIGHIDERRRPEGFPHEIVQQVLIEVETAQAVAQAYAELERSIINRQGMTVFKDTTKPLKLNERDQRIFVPFSMITYVESATQVLSSPIPEKGEMGYEVQNSEELDEKKEVKIQ